MRTTMLGSVIAACLLAAPMAVADESTPWAFNAPRADGYSIDLISADPSPGTVLQAGAPITYTVKVKYQLTAAPHGEVLLVFEDEKNDNIVPDKPQQSVKVNGPSGELTLSQTIVVPRTARELVLYVPIVPDGLDKTTGEITLRYPIKPEAGGTSPPADAATKLQNLFSDCPAQINDLLGEPDLAAVLKAQPVDAAAVCSCVSKRISTNHRLNAALSQGERAFDSSSPLNKSYAYAGFMAAVMGCVSLQLDAALDKVSPE